METAIEQVYKEMILEHYRHPLNQGALANFDATGEDFSISCGDSIRLYVKYSLDDRLVDISHAGYGCAISQAAVSLLTNKVKNLTLGEITRFSDDDMVKMLGIPISGSRWQCATLGWRVLQEIIRRNH